MIAAAGLALSSGNATKAPPAPLAPIQVVQEHVAKPWTPDGLDPELHAIAHLESSFGQNMKHAINPKGVFQTAFGAVGFKPQSGHEQYLRSPDLQKEYPGLTKPEDFTSHFQEDPLFYNKVASKHWQWLRTKLGSPAKAAYGWRYGATAAAKTDEQIQREDPYVHKFSEMSHNPLTKMSINDVTPGQKKKQFVWDYSHLLTPENKMAGYQVMVSFHPASVHPKFGKLRDRFHGEILHNGKPVGSMSAALHHNCLGGPCIEPHITIQDGHHQRGLGTALYTGVFKEAKMAGIKSVHGYEHSDAAHGLHSKLAKLHGMGYKPADADGDSEYPHGQYKYLIKSEPLVKDDREHAGTIRRLLASDKAEDWTTALRIPSANQADMDFLLDRLATVPAKGDGTEGVHFPLGGAPAAGVLNRLRATRFWNRDVLHRAMTLPVFRNSRSTSAFLDNGATDESTIDAMLGDVDVWAPQKNYNQDDGASEEIHRPGLDVIANAQHLTPAHFDKIYGLIHHEKLQNDVPSYVLDNHDQVPPEYVSKWLDYATSNHDRFTMGKLGKFISNDDLFEKVLKLPPKIGGRALKEYAASGRMTDKHLHHLLAHPGSLVDGHDREYDSDAAHEAGNVQEAIHKHLENAKDISPEAAQALIKHPNQEFVGGLFGRKGMAPEVYRALADKFPDHAYQFVGDANVPEDVRVGIVKKMLDNGEEANIPYHLRQGLVRRETGPNEDNDADFIDTPISKEMVDLAVNHPNPAMVPAAVSSPHLTTEQAVGLINKDRGTDVLRGINTKSSDGQVDNVDKSAVVKAIANRPQDSVTRHHLAVNSVMKPYLGKEFYDSVANHEMALVGKDEAEDAATGQMGHMGAANQTQWNLVRNLVEPTSNPPADFLQRAMRSPNLQLTAIHHPNLPQATFDEHFPDFVAKNGAYNMLRSDTPNLKQKHLEYLKSQMDASRGKDRANAEYGLLYGHKAWTPEKLGQMWHDEKLMWSPKHMPDQALEVRNAILENPNRPESVVDDFMMHPDVGLPSVDLDAAKARRRMITDGSLSKAALRRYAEHFEKEGGDPASPNFNIHKSDLAKKAREKLAVFEPDSVYRQPLGDAVPAHAMLTGNPDFIGNLVRDVGAPQGHVLVRPGMQKLRKIRDLIMQKSPENGEIKPKDLPPGDWSAGRLPNGNISAKKLNEHIDSQEPADYNFSHTNWQGAQRHSSYKAPAQKVFQLNLTNDHFDKLDQAGVGDTFRKMVNLSQTSSHPVRMNHTLGWVRYDGDKDKGFHVDEIQSDFGQSFVKQMAGQAANAGHDVDAATARAQAEYPEEHYTKIKNILFKDKHPNEMIAEAFHQYLRDQGHSETPVHMLHAETKAPISGQRKDKPLPGHMQFTYKDLPAKKLGMEPASYGQIESQNNPDHKDKPTWKGKVRKFEQEAAAWGKSFGIESLAKAVEEGSFKGISKAIDPTGFATVDHHHFLDAHPSSATDSVNDYRANVLESPTRNKRLSSKGLDGITSKVVYKTHQPDGTENRFMIKPFHERVIRRVKDWMRHPVQGAAEMMNQSLYHAAGIGHLHQNVATIEHPMRINGESRMEPALVVKLANGFKPVADHHFTDGDSDLHEDVRKIAIMDLLTNNLDRHALNLLINPETRKLLAVDHSRSMQYHTSGKPRYKWSLKHQEERLVRPEEGAEDSLDTYIKGSGAISKVLKPPSSNVPSPGSSYYKAHEEYRNGWAKTIEEWWPSVSESLRSELDKHLPAIKNPILRAHIRRNFHTRADLLDEISNMGLDNYGQTDWGETPIQMHKYGE